MRLRHCLRALLLQSIRIESHMRLLQMENAMRHLDRERDDFSSCSKIACARRKSSRKSS